MSKRWIQRSEKMLDRIKELREIEAKDRLDLVRSIHLVLHALHGSLAGWMQWVNNPNMMTKFTKDELEDINRELSELTHSFIEYDLKITQRKAETTGKAKRKRPDELRAFYV